LPDLQEDRLAGRALLKSKAKQDLRPRPVMNKIDLWDLDSVALGLFIILFALVWTGFTIYGIWAKISALWSQ
jgi:hypothetical protein